MFLGALLLVDKPAALRGQRLSVGVVDDDPRKDGDVLRLLIDTSDTLPLSAVVKVSIIDLPVVHCVYYCFLFFVLPRSLV